MAFDPKSYGAVGDGVTNDAAAFAAMDAQQTPGAPIILSPGSYRIGTNLTLTHPLRREGGTLIIADGVTLTLNCPVEVGPEQLFVVEGTGEVQFDHRQTWSGYAEWWGASADLSVDSYAAIMTALKALLFVQLQAGDYKVSSTVRMIYGHRTLAGSGSKYEDTNAECTRLLVADGSQYALQVGPDAYPGSINALQKDNCVKDIYVGRVAAATIASECVGVEVQWTLYARLHNVKSADSMIGFRFYGTVATHAVDCESVRAIAGSGSGADSWRGFWCDGGADIGAAGGNASIYLVRCSAACNIASLQTGQSQGFYLDQKFTDIFLEWPETVNCATGIEILGDAALGNNGSNTDLHINHPVMDQFHNAGIFITTVAEAGSLDICSPYFGPAADARASLWINASPAAVSVTGGQFVHGGAPGAQPIIIDGSSGVTIIGAMILEAGNTHAAVGLNNATNCRVQPTLKNRFVSGAAAVQLSGTNSGNIVQPVIMGKASAFTFGIQILGTGTSRSEFNLSGIDSSCIAGRSGNKLVNNGVPITAAGAFASNNLASGVMA